MNDDRYSIDIPKRWLRRALIGLAAAMLVLPAAAWAGHQFTDVPSSHTFHDDIDWMKDNRVTIGCNPPENTQYCPERDLTRAEMAAFLHRLDTRDVFVTPGELDAQSHHAVIDGDTGDVIAQDGLEVATKVDGTTGAYVLDFAAVITDCSWTGALGARDGVIRSSHTLTLNGDGTEDDQILVNIVDGDGNAADHDFNVTVTCW